MSALASAALIEAHADETLIAIGDARLSRADAYLPLLVAFTHEDKEAKGLRKLVDPDLPRPPVYFSAVEAAAMDRALLLRAPHGAGKTSFALDLALSFAGEASEHPRFRAARLERPVPRNDLGACETERWDGPIPRPLYAAATPALDAAALDALLAPHWAEPAPLLLILDNAERLGERGAALAAMLGERLAQHPALRVLMLGEDSVCGAWPLPEGFASHALLPLLDAQKRLLGERLGPDRAGTDRAPTLPQAFVLSRAAGADAASLDESIEQLIRTDAPEDPDALDRAAARAFAAWRADRARAAPQDSALIPLVLAARHLAGQPVDALLALFRADPDRWTLPIERLAARGGAIDALAIGLARDGARGAVLSADLLERRGDIAGWEIVVPALLAAIDSDTLPVALRARAGRHLGRQGDPRDLEQLVAVPAGGLVMGSTTHSNSMPVHSVEVESFRIGRYPVTNRAYARFVDATGRAWRSTDGRVPERANAPAVDLSWHDARAFCGWLSTQWRADGRLARHETVRLPTEAEWEAAARGPQADRGDAIVYPWDGAWRDACANSAEAGFNDTCAVGLFPAGRSWVGAEDMTGQVWEWCTTLWGRDPAMPELPYPYRAADREDPDAAPDVRRVLRGGCFSSNRLKACCTYRGSLEPLGFWRGNGFRIVVAG